MVVFEPFVNFGFVALNQTKTKSIIFKNQGSLADTLYIGGGSNFKSLEINPPEFTIKPKKTQKVTLSYTPEEPGIFRAILNVEGRDKYLPDSIEVTATSVEYF